MSATTIRLSISCFALLMASFAFAKITASGEENRIYVTDVGGSVDVAVDGTAYQVDVDSTILLPSHIVTGNDGRLDLRQSDTSISIAPDSEVSIPAAAAEGQLIARLVQHSGNVFFDVQKREIGRFRVETPYLVAVVKGTQFNVSVQNERTTITLFEGRLELIDPDGGESLEIVAGDVAYRSLDDPQIRVIGPNDLGPGVGSLGLGDGTSGGDSSLAGVQNPDAVLGLGTLSGTDVIVGNEPGTNDPTGMEALGGGLAIELGDALGASSVQGSVTLGAGGGGALDLGADLDLGGASASADLEAGIDLGGGGLDLGADLDLGGVSAETGLPADLDLGGGDLGLGADPGLGTPGAELVDDLVPDAGDLALPLNVLP